MTINKKVDHKKLWFQSLDGMATGFFGCLIVAFFVGLLGEIPKLEIFTDMKWTLSYMTPFVIGITIGLKAEKSLFQIIAMGLAAMLVGHSTFHPNMEIMKKNFFDGFNNVGGFSFKKMGPGSVGDAFSSWLTGSLMLYIFAIFNWESKFDFIIIPVLGIAVGMFGMTFITFITQTIAGIIGYSLGQINDIKWLLIIMAPIIAIVMGVALTMPISSAALAIMIGMEGNIAIIALAGTTAQMLAWAVMTYYANRDWSETTAVGFGTSMFHLNNFVRKPKLFVIPIIASALSGLITALIFVLSDWSLFPNITSSPGMGWAAMYGPVLTLVENKSSLAAWTHVLFIQTLLPLLIAIPLTKLFFKKEKIVSEDLHLWAKNTSQSISQRQKK